jgi:hypothetical protein
VLIAGGGLAALETLLALRAVAADQLDISLLAPGWTFTDRSATIRQPFEAPCARTLRLADVASDLGARWYQTTLDRVELGQDRADVYGVTPTFPGRLASLAGDVDRCRHVADERLDAVLGHMRVDRSSVDRYEQVIDAVNRDGVRHAAQGR